MRESEKILANSFWMIVGLSAVLTLVLFVFKRNFDAVWCE